MSGFAALLRGSAKWQAACSKSNSVKLQLALHRWQLCSDRRALSAKAGDQDSDGGSFAIPFSFASGALSSSLFVFGRGRNGSFAQGFLAHVGGGTALGCGFRCLHHSFHPFPIPLQALLTGSDVAGIDQAGLKEQQQVTARQLQQQQKTQALAGDSPDTQQSALDSPHEEVVGYGDEDQVSATPSMESSLEASGPGTDEAMPVDTPSIAEVDQPTSQLSDADPAEASSQPKPEPMVATPEPSWLSEAAELSVDERIDVFLKAIRSRSWEQTDKQPVVWAEGAKPELQLPHSGYSEIAGSSSRIKGQMLNPGRTFYPGQAYEPEVCLSCLY